MTHALPALLVGLTALVTGGLVHAGYGLWWLSHHLLHVDTAYDWSGAMATSGTVTAVVLIAGLLMRRMVSGNAQPIAGEAAQTPTPAPVALRANRA